MPEGVYEDVTEIIFSVSYAESSIVQVSDLVIVGCMSEGEHIVVNCSSSKLNQMVIKLIWLLARQLILVLMNLSFIIINFKINDFKTTWHFSLQ